jgi:LysM repeat protein
MHMKPIAIAVQAPDTVDRTRRVIWITAAIATALTVLASSAGAQRRGRIAEPQSLHGSRASVEKMYDFARRHRYPFYLTPTNVDAAVAQGRLVALGGDTTYELTRGVGFSYATREAKQFVTAFAPQYLHACGTPLTVTSAARPMSRQPHNANKRSVHPTGIAVDLRRPPPGPCLTWVRNALADLESRGIIEATEEHHPVHLHLAVLAAPGQKVVLPNLVQGTAAAPRVPVVQVAAAQPTVPGTVTAVAAGDVHLPATAVRTYVVRQGDTLYDIAMQMGVSVQALSEANDRRERAVLKPGITLTVPPRGTK